MLASAMNTGKWLCTSTSKGGSSASSAGTEKLVMSYRCPRCKSGAVTVMGKSSWGMIGPTLKSGDEPRLAAGKGTVIHPSHTPLGTENSLRVNIDPWWKGDEAIQWASSREYGGRCGAPGPTPRTAMDLWSRGEKSERLLVSTPSNFGGSPSGAENTWKSVGLQEGLPIGLRVIWRPSPDACSDCAPESEASAAAGAAAGATSVAAMTAMMRTDALTRRRNVMLRSPHDRVL